MRIVLVEPEIHWNTGNIGRTCVATGAELHLVGPLGFRLDAKEIRRAGLDYWERLKLVRHADFAGFLKTLPAAAPLYFFSAEADRSFWDASYAPQGWLVFGKESVGLPAELRRAYKDRLYRIPIGPGVRSLNLSTAAGIVLYEALRQQGFSGAERSPAR